MTGLLFLVAGPSASAQYGSASQTVTVSPSVISYVTLSVSSVNMSFTGAEATAGVDAMTKTDQSCIISWGTNSGSRKLTAVSSIAIPVHTLKLIALNPTVGTVGTEFPLSTTAKDLLLNIGRSMGTATLRYTAIVLASEGTATDSHTVTFTLQAQ